jgi:hypothetical protein
MHQIITAAVFFGLGMNLYILYLPLIVLFIFSSISIIRHWKINRKSILLMLLFCAIPLPILFFGMENFVTDNYFQNLKLIITFTFAVTFGCVAIGQQASAYKEFLVFCYIIGMFSESMIIVLNSIFVGNILSGYGKLLNPFNGLEINSPSVGNNLVIATSFILCLYAKSRRFTTSAIYFLVLSASIAAGIFLGGRIFGLALGVVTVLLFALRHFALRNLSFLLLLTMLFFLGIDQVSHKSEAIFVSSFMSVKSRFSEESLNSARFSHFTDGVYKILYHPLGGFKTNSDIEITYWFHNLFIDIATLGGWLSLVLTIFSIVYATRLTLSGSRNGKSDNILLIVFFVSLIIVNQDVIFDGNQRPLILMFYISIALSYNTMFSERRENRSKLHC